MVVKDIYYTVSIYEYESKKDWGRNRFYFFFLFVNSEKRISSYSTTISQ